MTDTILLLDDGLELTSKLLNGMTGTGYEGIGPAKYLVFATGSVAGLTTASHDVVTQSTVHARQALSDAELSYEKVDSYHKTIWTKAMTFTGTDTLTHIALCTQSGTTTYTQNTGNYTYLIVIFGTVASPVPISVILGDTITFTIKTRRIRST